MEDINGSLGIRATIDASDVQKGSNEYVQRIQEMQMKTDEVARTMNSTFDELMKGISNFGRSANGVSLTELQTQLDEAKKSFVSASDEVRKQKGVIKETAQVLGDLKAQLEQAKESGKGLSTYSSLEADIKRANATLSEHKYVLADLEKEQATAKDKVTELTLSLSELQKMQPSFDTITNGTSNAANQVAMLTEEFNKFMETYNSVKQGIGDLSADSLSALQSGQSGEQAIALATSTNDTMAQGGGSNIANLGVDLSQFDFKGYQTDAQGLQEEIKRIGEAYSVAAASANVALEQQASNIDALKQHIADLKQVQQDALKGGNTEGAALVGEHIKQLEGELTTAQLKYSQLSEKAKEANRVLQEFQVGQGIQSGTEQIEILKGSLDDFIQKIKDSKTEIEGLKGDSQEEGDKAQSGLRTINYGTSFTKWGESGDETTQRTQAVKAAMEEVNEAYTNSAAKAKLAFTEQSNLVSNLEEKIKELQAIMNNATENGNMNVANEAARQIEVLNPLLTEAKNNMSDLQKESEAASQRVADFGNRSEEINQKLDDNSTTLGRIKQTFKDVGGYIGGGFKKNLGQGKQVISSLVSTIDGMGIPLSSSIKGMKGLTKETLKFVFTPIGAVITAVVLGLKALHQWLTKSAEGQKVMSQMSAYLGSIMSSLMDIVMALGKSIFKSFSASKKEASSFITYFVKSFVNGFNFVKNSAIGLGKVFKGIWQVVTGDFSEGWKSLKEGAFDFMDGIKELPQMLKNLTSGIVDGAKGLAKGVYGVFTDGELGKAITNSFTNMFSKARTAYDTAGKEFKLKSDEYDAQVRAKKLDDEIAQRKENIYKLTGKEKDAEIEKVKVLEKEKYYGKTIYDQKTKTYKHEKGLIDIEKEKLNLVKTRNSLHTKSLAAIKEERAANLSLLQTQVQAAASTRMMTRMQEANKRKMASSAKSDAKSNLNKSNAVTEAEGKQEEVESANLAARVKSQKDIADKIADATIAAEANAEERVRKERERKNKKELEDIASQHEAAIAAEIKLQKAEFQAEQAVIKAKGGKVRKWDDEKDLNQGRITAIDNQFEQLTTFTQKKQDREQYDSYSQEYDKSNAQKEQQKNKLKADIASLDELLKKALGDEAEAQDATSKTTAKATAESLKNLKKNAQAQLEWVTSSAEAWNNYYSKYGTFLEKREALEKKFKHDTQGMDKQSPEYQTRLREYQSSLSLLSASEVKSNIDWSSVFSNVGLLSGKMARIQLAQLQGYTQTDEFKNLDASDQKTITDAIANLEKQVQPYFFGAFKRFGKAVDKYKNAIDELNTLKNEEVNAHIALNEAIKKEAKASAELAEAQENLSQAQTKGEQEGIKAAQTNVDAAQANLKNAKEATKQAKQIADGTSASVMQQSNAVGRLQEDVKKSGKNITSSFDLVSSAIQSLKSGSLSGTFNSIMNIVDAFHDVSKSANKSAKEQEKAAQQNSVTAQQSDDAQKKMNNAIGAVGQAMQLAPNVWAKAIGAILSVLDILGDDLEGGIGNLVGTLLENVGNIIETLLSQIGSGKFFKDIGKGVFNLVGGIGRGFGDMFGIRDNWNDYRKAAKRYEKLDKVWTSLISKKKEYLSLSYGDEAKQVGKELTELAKADLEEAKALANQYLGAWKKGSHSAGYKFDKKMRKGIDGVTWSNISAVTGANVSQISDLTNLSYKQLEKLKTQYTEWWVEMPEDYRNYLDSIIEKQQTLEDAQDAVLEKLTGVKFDDMYSSFMSSLSDMSKGADDFVSDFKNKMLTALIDNTIGDSVKEWTEDFVKRYQQAVKDSDGKISDATAQNFREELSEASNSFFNQRETIANSIGMGSSDTDSQQKQGYATASEESIEELSGRTLAQTQALYTIQQQNAANSITLSDINSNLNVVVDIEKNRTPYYEESIELQRNAVSYLAGIQKNTNELYTMNERLDKIERNTRNL